MLRCPFNNFSKCDGSCPFSMPDFAGCKIATSLTAIEGIVRGIGERVGKMHMEQVTTNAHLTALRTPELLAEDVCEDVSDTKRRHDPRSYLVNESRGAGKGRAYRISVSESDADGVIGTIGDKADIFVIRKPVPKIILSPGDEVTVSRNGRRLRISPGNKQSQLADAFGVHDRVYLEAGFDNGIVTLTADGDVYDEGEM